MTTNEVLVPCSTCPNWFWVKGEHFADIHHEEPPVRCDWCETEYRFSLSGDVVKKGTWPNDAFRERVGAKRAQS